MSSGSESDEEYVPGEPEQVSEEDSADEETDLQYEEELQHKTTKRKAVEQSKGKKKRKTKNRIKEAENILEENKAVVPEKVDPEEEKKREDDLWAKFLEGTDSKHKTASNVTNETKKPSEDVSKDKDQKKGQKQNTNDDKDREKRIFEFAGETIVVENNVIKEKIKPTVSPATASKVDLPSSRSRGVASLSNVVGQLNKKNRLSTLEKSKLDWETYKKEEGIEEEIKTHNKGKDGYLDRRDFLERADLRQYEIERDLKMSRRSNR